MVTLEELEEIRKENSDKLRQLEDAYIRKREAEIVGSSIRDRLTASPRGSAIGGGFMGSVGGGIYSPKNITRPEPEERKSADRTPAPRDPSEERVAAEIAKRGAAEGGSGGYTSNFGYGSDPAATSFKFSSSAALEPNAFGESAKEDAATASLRASKKKVHYADELAPGASSPAKGR